MFKVNEIINKAALKTIQRVLKNDSMHTSVEIGRPSLCIVLVPGYNWKVVTATNFATANPEQMSY